MDYSNRKQSNIEDSIYKNGRVGFQNESMVIRSRLSHAITLNGLDLKPIAGKSKIVLIILLLFKTNRAELSYSTASIKLLKFLFLGLSYLTTTQLLISKPALAIDSIENQSRITPVFSNENFTFLRNGSFIQIDAGREWPFNSKREISFRFKTKSPHGLLIYQTFDHNKLQREDDQDNSDIIPPSPVLKTITAQNKLPPLDGSQAGTRHQTNDDPSRTMKLNRRRKSTPPNDMNIRHLNRPGNEIGSNVDVPLAQLPSSTITATASEKLVNSLFSSSPMAAINGNDLMRNALAIKSTPRDKSLLVSSNGPSMLSSRDANSIPRNRLLNNMAIASDSNRLNYGVRANADPNDGSTVLSSSTISSLSASLYELYLKLENGRLKIMYEFGSRLNQTYCGKGLNDDRWHKIDLKVDPEINQMILILDQVITVEIVLSQQQHEEETSRRNELVFTNSVLYLGGLNNNASIVKNVRQRLYLAQFIGCIGQIMLKTDQHTESTLQPATIDRLVLVKRGCINLCDTDNYCLHKSACVNYYTHTKCDCFGTNYEDIYCWQHKITTLSMFGYSTLVYRIYDWRERHHSSINRLSLQFRTLASDSILFFAYGDLSAQPTPRNQVNLPQANSGINSIYNMAQVNISNLPTIHRPTTFQYQGNNNYLAVSLSNGSIVVEVNFGDQPVLLSNLLYDKISNLMSKDSTDNSSYLKPLVLSDGRWHNVTFTHNNKQVSLYLDNYSVNFTILGKNNHLYFDPSIYVGSVPNFLFNETRTLMRPFNLRHKFVGCLRSVYFNQHNILLALKQGSTMADYRDILGKPQLDTCITPEPSSLPLTLRSGKSYLTFQLSTNHHLSASHSLRLESSQMATKRLDVTKNQTNYSEPVTMLKKTTRIEFEYKTSLQTYFLAGGHLRDLSYHDLGGFWTLHAREECQLYFTISSGLTFDPEQILKLNMNNKSCEPDSWYKISISIISGDRVLNITRTQVVNEETNANEKIPPLDNLANSEHGSYLLESSVELLHQVQLGGDLAKFGESSSIPFSGCMRRIMINGHTFDSRDFVTPLASVSPLTGSNLNQQQQQNSTAPFSGQAQHDVISSRMAQGYVTIDSCQLVNPCSTLNPCKNNGVCKINELGEPDCDCSKTGYTGKRCHFSIYKQSCQDLFLSGQRKSSYYLIDLDRNGPLKPIRVRCNMEDGGNQIETSLSHNLPAEYFIRRSTPTDIVLDITYLAFHHMYTHDGFYLHDDDDESARASQDLMLRSLIDQSLFCKQYFRYECRSAPLNLGNKTWMEVPYPRKHKLVSLDGSSNGRCACASSEKKCLDPKKNCNCDSGEPVWSDDSNELFGDEQVGLTRIVLLRQDDDDDDLLNKKTIYTEPQSRFTLSDLKCYGTRQHGSEHEITFKTSDAYIEVPGWRRGDISFSFRTASNPPAIVLYQLATSRNHGYFRLTMVSDVRLLFEFIVNRRPRKLFLTSSHKLNNGEWQQVFIECDSVNLRLTVNDDSAMVDLDSSDHLGTFEGPLFIGGAPSKYLVGDLSKRNGFTGCFRGLKINGKPIDLNSYLSPSMPTVIGGCQPSCTKNLCQNGGKCIEYWGSYECECSNPIAHSGSNCEINLNTNSITFVTQESHYVQHSNESLPYPAYLMKNILLNIRTYQETALVLYASDRFNNFIQLHKNGSSMVLTFNSNASVVTAQLPIDDEDVLSNPLPSSISVPTSTENPPAIATTINATHNHQSPSGNLSSHGLIASKQIVSTNTASHLLNLDRPIRVSNTSGSGQPIQIKIERHRLRTTFYVNHNFIVIEKPIIFLSNFTQNPWINPEHELVRPTRPKVSGKMQSRLFLAAIDESFTTRLPGFTGCIQGLSIDNQLFDFNRAHLTGELRGEYKIGCKMQCDSFPCKNQGTCIENWMEDKIQCKCDTTSYVGRLCDEDIAAIFNGRSSYFVYYLTKFLEKMAQPKLAQLNQNDSLTTNTSLPNRPTSLTINTDRTETLQTSFETVSPKSIINHLEVSLAFSSEANHTPTEGEASVQVLVLITRANSSKHFFLGLTSDGSLLIQEDYGNSMSLSRLIKKPDQPYNDGYRHMFKYSRFNQTIQIIVDHQAFLPTMSVITTNHASRFSRASLISVGTAGGQQASGKSSEKDEIFDNSYTNYNGCISNLLIKIDDISIEPLSEAFGQNLETMSVNVTERTSINDDEVSVKVNGETTTKKVTTTGYQASKLLETQEGYTPLGIMRFNGSLEYSRMLNSVNKEQDQEIVENMETIVAKDVEQGKCASFKKIEITNEKRSVNEPRYTPLLDPRPIYMDPPRIKIFRRLQAGQPKEQLNVDGFGLIFYCSLTFLIVSALLTSMYAYVLQVRYKSEKFRCETPFFHRRDDNVTNTPTLTK